jgi:hypothetical protein
MLAGTPTPNCSAAQGKAQNESCLIQDEPEAAGGNETRPSIQARLLVAAGEQEDLRPIFASAYQAAPKEDTSPARTREDEAKALLLACCYQEAQPHYPVSTPLLHACSVDDDAGARLPILFQDWVTLIERYWVSSGERRSASQAATCRMRHRQGPKKIRRRSSCYYQERGRAPSSSWLR